MKNVQIQGNDKKPVSKSKTWIEKINENKRSKTIFTVSEYTGRRDCRLDGK